MTEQKNSTKERASAGVVLERIVMPDSCSIITVDWLDNLQIMLISSVNEFDSFIITNDLERSDFANLWNEANGGVDIVEIEGTRYYIMTIANHARRVVIHECVHAAHLIMDQKGIPINFENSEVTAYLTDYLCEEVFSVLGA